MSYTTTLVEVDDDGVLLGMADGVVFEVDEADIPTTICWTESAQIEVTPSTGPGDTHVLRNRSSDQRVRPTVWTNGV
jgi:hypothetical protein